MGGRDQSYLRTQTMLSTLLLFSLVGFSTSVDEDGLQTALVYLTKYGYDNSTVGSVVDLTNVDMREAILEFQQFAGIDLTGELNAETLELMQTPRCGVKD